MAVIVYASVAGAPGVTTTAVGSVLRWPRPALLVEVDVARPSGVLAGFLRGQVFHSRGLTPLSVAHPTGAIPIEAIWGQTVHLAPERLLLPGFDRVAAAHGTPPTFWSRLGDALNALESAGMDVIVDAGRLGVRDARFSLLRTAHALALFSRPTLSDVAALDARRAELLGALEPVGKTNIATLVLCKGNEPSFAGPEIARKLGVPVIATMSSDPAGASHYSAGTPAKGRSTLAREIDLLNAQLLLGIRRRADELGQQPTSEEVGA